MTASNADQISTPGSNDSANQIRRLNVIIFDVLTSPVATTATSPNTTIVGYARVITKYGDCNIIDYSATTGYKDYSVTECDDCIVTRFTRVSNERLDRQSTAIFKASPYQTTSLSLDRIQIDLQESIGRRLRQQWCTRSIDRFDDLDPFLFFNITRSPTSNTANGLTITLPCTTPNIVSKSPILVQFSTFICFLQL